MGDSDKSRDVVMVEDGYGDRSGNVFNSFPTGAVPLTRKIVWR